MESFRFTFEAIGTRWGIDLPEKISPEKKDSVIEKTKERIALFDKTYSRFRDDSLIHQMSQKTRVFLLPEDAKPLLDLYEKLYTLTEGAFTPLIGQVLVDAGYDATYSLKEKPLQTPPSWEKALSYTFPAITIKERVVLDFGAGGKGYLVDIIGVLIESFGINTYTIDAGGDILHKGKDGEALKVGLENPNNFKQIIGVADITSGSICGSAGNRRVWGNFHHIIDPKTLTSPRSIASVWTTAKTALLADSLATCLFFSPHNELKKHFDFEYAILYSDFSLEKSEKFPGEFFTQ